MASERLMSVEARVVERFRSELRQRMGRAEGETLLHYLEEPLGGPVMAEDFWDDIYRAVSEELHAPRQPTRWGRLLWRITGGAWGSP